MKDDPKTPEDRALSWKGKDLTLEEVADLLRRGANPNVASHSHWRPIHVAAVQCDVERVRLLLEAGADPSPRAAGTYPLRLPLRQWCDERGPLGDELVGRILATIELLLAAGARFPEDESLAELLHAPLPALRRLLELGVRADLPDDEARLAIHVAVRPMAVAQTSVEEAFPRLDVVRLLLEHGVALDVADGEGRTPLALALAEEAAAPDDEHLRAMAEVIALLRAAGAPLEASGKRTERRHGARLEELGQPTTFEQLSARHAAAPWLRWFLENRTLVSEEPTPRLLQGDLRLARDLKSGEGPWVMILEGDLETSGDLDFTTGDYAVSTLIVLGDVRARNVSFSSSARVSITGNLFASGLVIGTNGDSSACLGTAKTLTARAVLLDEHTSISADSGAGFRTLLAGARGWQEFEPDVVLDPETNEAFFHPEVLRQGSLDHGLALEHARRGVGPFLPEVERELRRKKGLPPL